MAAEPYRVIQPTLLDELLRAPFRFAIQRIQNLRGEDDRRYEWFYRPAVDALSTQQVFDRLASDPRSYELEARIVAAGLEWAVTERRSISINLSPGAISSPEFRLMLLGTLDRFTLEPGQVWWEITEAWPIADPGEARHTVDMLRGLLQTIAVDDVDSVRHLEKWTMALGRPDVVKVDQSVVQSRPHALPGLIEAIIACDAVPVVEGVECHAGFLDAQRSGAHYLQGYYLAEPRLVSEEHD